MYNDDGLTRMLEEADNRIVCHVSHMIEKGRELNPELNEGQGITNVKVRTVNTGVIVILLTFMHQFLLLYW